MKSYSLYLSTAASSGSSKPVSKTNLAQVKWAINWKEIFGNRNVGECRLRFRFLSNSSNTLSWANNVGSIRTNLTSNSGNNNNGFNIGFIRPQSDYTTGTAQTTYLDGDTTTGNGASILIPNSNNDFYITLLNNTETLMVNVPDYQIWLYFDVDDEDPNTDKTLFYPR